MIGEQRLELKAVEIREGTARGKVPGNWDEGFENWDPWPSVARMKGIPNFLAISPKKDDDGVSILGGLYLSILPESVVVKSGDGAKTFEMGKDYKYNERWGQVANLEGRLGKAGEGELVVTYKYATQRLDLVQVDGSGKASVKAGRAVMVCPQLPAADAGHKAVAGVYLAPWRQVVPKDAPDMLKGLMVPGEDGSWDVRIFPISEVAPVAPVNAGGVAKVKVKMERGEEVKIAFLGDSITLGAEAGRWWEDMWTERSLTYASRLVTGLRKKYAKATVTPIAAFKGGITVKAAAPFMEKDVLPQRPDLVVIAFGLNDAAGAVGGKATNPPESYKGDILALVKQAKAVGSEVLLVTPFEGSPFLKNGQGQRMPEYRRVLMELAKEEEVGCADVYTEWMNQTKRGVPAWSQVHNWINHPGAEGHGLYASVLLRFFE
jgi:lysophospholipase L1-like esterase